MEKAYIATLNNISKVGLGHLTDKYELTEDLNKANGIIVRSYKMHDMDFSDSLMAIGRAGAGVNNIPLDKCAEKGIVVFNAPGANSNAVKELVIGSMIMGARNLYEGMNWAQSLDEDVAAQVEKGKKQFAGTEISGKTLGVIGLGAIGAKVANAAYALGMNIVGNSVVTSPLLTAPTKMYDSIPEMVKECDYITIHVPSLPSTKGMINNELISNMKDGTVLLNFARPDLINEEDVINAVESGKLSKYMSDLPNDRLVNRKNIILTPHLGASTKEAEDNCAAMAVDKMMDYIENGNIQCSVNFPAVSLDKKDNTKRVGIMSNGIDNMTEIVKNAIGTDNIVDICEGKKRSEFGYTLVLIKDSCDITPLTDCKETGIINVKLFA